MVQQIISKKHAVYPLSPNLPKKTITKNGIKYVLVKNDPIKQSKCLALIKATGLTLLGAAGFTFALKEFRTALFDNWRAVFTGDRKVEKYRIAGSTTSDIKPPSKSIKKTKKTVKAKPAKKIANKKQKISDKNTLSIIYHGIPKSYLKFTIKNLEAYRENVLQWMNDKNQQKDIYKNENPNTAIVDSTSLKQSNIDLDRYELQVVLRYMVLIGDITAYESARVGHRVAFRGVEDFTHESGELPITRSLLLEIDKKMKLFVPPTMPDDYNSEQSQMWYAALHDIQRELYNRNLRPLKEENAVICKQSENKSCHQKFKRVFDDLVNAGTIIEWNAFFGNYQAIMKIGVMDQYDTSLIYLWPEWRDSTVIALDK